MNELSYELIIKIFEKIDLKDYKTIVELGKVNYTFNKIYKKYFEKNVKQMCIMNLLNYNKNTGNFSLKNKNISLKSLFGLNT
jgi:hypothetical protein